jgi:hypothetical protein
MGLCVSSLLWLFIEEAPQVGPMGEGGVLGQGAEWLWDEVGVLRIGQEAGWLGVGMGVGWLWGVVEALGIGMGMGWLWGVVEELGVGVGMGWLWGEVWVGWFGGVVEELGIGVGMGWLVVGVGGMLGGVEWGMLGVEELQGLPQQLTVSRE